MTAKQFQLDWFSMMTENPTKANPVATAMMFAFVAKTLSTSSKFLDIDKQEVMLVLGIKDSRVYVRSLQHLNEHGFITIHEQKKNQSTRTLIEITYKPTNLVDTKATFEQCSGDVEATSKRRSGDVQAPENVPQNPPPYPPIEENIIINSSSSTNSDLVEDAEEEGEVAIVKPLVSLDYLVNRFKEKPGNENKYPPGFYADFLTYFEGTADKDPTKMIWQMMCNTIDKDLWVSRQLEIRWEMKKHLFTQEPKAQANGYYPPQHRQGVGTGIIGPINFGTFEAT